MAAKADKGLTTNGHTHNPSSEYGYLIVLQCDLYEATSSAPRLVPPAVGFLQRARDLVSVKKPNYGLHPKT